MRFGGGGGLTSELSKRYIPLPQAHGSSLRKSLEILASSPHPSTTTTVRDPVPGGSGSASAGDEAIKGAAVVTPGTELIAHALMAIKQCPFLCCVVEC